MAADEPESKKTMHGWSMHEAKFEKQGGTARFGSIATNASFASLNTAE
jgi:hypothetical protein